MLKCQWEVAGHGIIFRFIDEYFFLSNFYQAKFSYNNIIYPTAEHCYQAAKATDDDDWADIVGAKYPGYAKIIGRNLKNIRPDWNEVRLTIMYNIVKAKFEQNKDIGTKLIATENKVLVEGNLHGDVFWGVGLGTGYGYNHLGRILMQVREELNNASS